MPGHETPGRVPGLSGLKTNMQWRSEKACPAPRRTGVPLLSHNTQRPSRCSETWLGLPYAARVQKLGQKGPEKVCMSLQIWSQADEGYETASLTSSTSKNDCYQKGLKSNLTGFQTQVVDYHAIIYYFLMLFWTAERWNVSETAGKTARAHVSISAKQKWKSKSSMPKRYLLNCKLTNLDLWNPQSSSQKSSSRRGHQTPQYLHRHWIYHPATSLTQIRLTKRIY